MKAYVGALFIFSFLLLSGCIYFDIFKYLNEPAKPLIKENVTAIEPEKPEVPSENKTVVEPEKPIEPEKPENNTVVEEKDTILGLWRIYTNKIYYDAGGGSDYLGVPTDYRLKIFEDGTWDYGDVKGLWTVENITDEDVQRWGAIPYGSTRKIIMVNWETFPVDGPIEEEENMIFFFWLIYNVNKTEFSEPGQVQLKFGRGFAG